MFVIQKLIRAAFGNNNVDTCARVCHSPTGYGLGTAFGTSAGTQDFDSVDESDVILVIGANPTDGHPVFASRMKRRLREGAKLIVVDPRQIDLVRMPHVAADHHLQLRPGTNVAVMNALAHVIATEGLIDEGYVAEHCNAAEFAAWRSFIEQPENAPEAVEAMTGVPAAQVRAAARLYATGGRAAIYYGLGVTEHSQGSTAVMAMANLAMATGNIGRRGVGVNPLRGQNNVQGACDMGSFPHELSGYRHVGDAATRALFEAAWGRPVEAEPGLRIPNMLNSAIDGTFMGLFIQGEDIAQSDPNTQHVTAALAAMECVVIQDLFLNETANYAHVFFPGASFLEKDGTFTNAERRISRVRMAMPPMGGKHEWQAVAELSTAMGYPMHYEHPSEIMDEIARLTPTFAGVSYARLDELGSIQWPCNDSGAHWARRSCMRAVLPVDRASSPSRPISRPTSVPGRASRCCSPRAASCRNTMSARRRDARTMSCGIRRTCSRSMRTTPRIAASATATGWRWPAAPARPRCGRGSRSESRRASSTRPSTIR